MSLNDTPSANRIHIGFFGCRNAGKSSIVNAVTGQELAVVSDTKGTTTDPVTKTMELLPLGPVVIIDTPGFDDVGTLGQLRVRKTKQILNKTDLAVLVIDGTQGLTDWDRQLTELFEDKHIPYLIACNKCDLPDFRSIDQDKAIRVSAATGENIYELKERIAKLAPTQDPTRHLVRDLVAPNHVAILVTPIDESAPKGRMILPQQQVMRDILDAGALPLLTRETELQAALDHLREPPSLVITDSQVFHIAAKITPDSIPLTSFSIIMARYKGFLDTAVAGAAALEHLHDGDTILVAEGCTHHRQCNDIGTVKLPRWLREYTGKELNFQACSGTEFPEDLSPFAAVIHCGACMTTEREVQHRMRCAIDQGIPFTNYGTTIAAITGTLERSLRPFPSVHALLG